jgi:hypothetical protein
MLAEVRLNDDHRLLMLAIGDAIAKHTTKSPMTLEAIVGVLGFCAGAAIIRGTKQRSTQRNLRNIAQGNVDQGMEAMTRAVSGTSLIMPEMISVN